MEFLDFNECNDLYNDVCSLIFYTFFVPWYSTLTEVASSEVDLVGTLGDQKQYYDVRINKREIKEKREILCKTGFRFNRILFY